jgi:hypothetical protein
MPAERIAMRDAREIIRLKFSEFRRRARIGAARVLVPDLRCEEFEEAIGSTGVTRGDERRRV